MFEYLCDHFIPGCPHTETGDTPEATREKALKHLHDDHGMEYLDEDAMARLNLAIVPFAR
jgi:predicted small metal-binding protein